MTAFIQKIYRYDHLISSRLCDFRSRESLTCVMTGRSSVMFGRKPRSMRTGPIGER